MMCGPVYPQSGYPQANAVFTTFLLLRPTLPYAVALQLALSQPQKGTLQ